MTMTMKRCADLFLNAQAQSSGSLEKKRREKKRHQKEEKRKGKERKEER